MRTTRPHGPGPRGRLRVVLALVLLVLVAPAGAATATATDGGHHGHAARYGTTGARFWQWGLTQPAATSPLFDTTGAFCDEGQRGRTWFLAGYTGGPITRTCTVPAGTTLVFPVVNAFYGATPGDPPEQSTVAFVREQVAGLRAGAHDLRVTVDGTALPASRIRYEDSVVFSVTLPDGNVFGAPAGTVVSPTVDAGYYVTLRPLRPGAHTVRIEGAVDAAPPVGSFSVDVTYVLTVLRGHRH
ncbi:hypothetical protein ACFO3K_08825 [Cellulomonas algicola]|uniref:hypothetical protein n=1 Tax=Cellulomonas algicola TaxID=2071633 RepID=UPI001C3F6D87|nr:hypothetical protein [Cellulomonas algicola]